MDWHERHFDLIVERSRLKNNFFDGQPQVGIYLGWINALIDSNKYIFNLDEYLFKSMNMFTWTKQIFICGFPSDKLLF